MATRPRVYGWEADHNPGRFNPRALYEALDRQREVRGIFWSQLGVEIGVTPSTITRTRLGGRMEVDGMLAMVRWLDRTVESFTFGATTSWSNDQPAQGQALAFLPQLRNLRHTLRQ